MGFSLSSIEKSAKGKDIASVTIHYSGREEPVSYPWNDRKRINWDNVLRCRLDFTVPKSYNIDGEACRRPGIRLKGK